MDEKEKWKGQDTVRFSAEMSGEAARRLQDAMLAIARGLAALGEASILSQYGVSAESNNEEGAGGWVDLVRPPESTLGMPPPACGKVVREGEEE